MRLVRQITVLDTLEELRLTNLAEVIMMKTKNISCPWIAVGASLLVLSCSKASDTSNRSVQQVGPFYNQPQRRLTELLLHPGQFHSLMLYIE